METLNQAPIPLIEMSQDGVIISASEDFQQLLDMSEQTLLGRSLDDLIDPASRRRWQEEIWPMLRHRGRITDVPVQLTDAKDREVATLMNAVSCENPSDPGRLLCVFRTTEDFDDFVLYRRRYRRVPAMLYTVKPDLTIEAVSNLWLKVLGYQREEVIGRSLNDFLAPEYAIAIDHEKRQVPGLKDIVDQPRIMVKKNGQLIEVLSSAWIETDSDGEPVRAHGAVKDVTLRNSIERDKEKAFEEIKSLKEELEAECNYLREEVHFAKSFGEIVGDSPPMHQVLARIDAVARTPATVLITGESGVGKELVARAIHQHSDRADKPLVKVNCASIPHDLFESEFFGHVKGAFTGAHTDRIGRFQLADGGIIFLDEVGEIPIDLQAKLLRVLQEQQFERVGEDKTRQVNVRVIAATNRNLAEAVEAGEFREDLYYRLNTFPVDVPPLRKRRQDIVPLAQYFLRQAAKKMGKDVQQLSRRQAENLNGYCWPGNVRELQSVIDRAVILSPTQRLQLELALPQSALAANQPKAEPDGDSEREVLTYPELEQLERRNIESALSQTNWRVSGRDGAAELLGIKASTLAYKMKTMGIQKSA